MGWNFVDGAIKMEWNLVVEDTKAEWHLAVGDTKMEWNFNHEKMSTVFSKLRMPTGPLVKIRKIWQMRTLADIGSQKGKGGSDKRWLHWKNAFKRTKKHKKLLGVISKVRKFWLILFSSWYFFNNSGKMGKAYADKSENTGGGGFGKCWHWMTQGAGGVQTPPFLADIIGEQPLTEEPKLNYRVSTTLIQQLEPSSRCI